MLRLVRTYRVWIVAALVIGTSILVVESSKTFQECIRSAKDKEGEYRAEKGLDKIEKIYSIRRDCIGVFLHENGEAVTATFTIVLAFSTIALWLSTRRLWEVTQVAADHIPTVERAYIYGGFGARGYGFAADGSWLIFAVATMANYGKTPGFIRRIAIGHGPVDSLPPDPVYQREVDVLDLYFPGMTMQDVRRTGVLVQIPANGSHAVFLRVFYTDILDDTREHFSGSVYRLYLGQDAEGNIVIFGEPIFAWQRLLELGSRRIEASPGRSVTAY
jgi:hypothetical protein